MLSNPILTLWPEGLFIAAAAACLVGLTVLHRGHGVRSVGVRLISILGFVVTGGTVSLGLVPSLYSFIAIPLIPSPIGFAIAIWRPGLLEEWRKMRYYLTGCVAAAVIVWTTQFFWLLTR